MTSSTAGRDPLGFLKPTAERWPLLLCPLIPIAVVLALVGAPDLLAFACSAIGVIPPAAPELVDYGGGCERLSLAIAGVLVLGYVPLLLFSLKTHRELFNPPGHEAEATWTARRAVGMLGLAGLVVAGMSEVLVH